MKGHRRLLIAAGILVAMAVVLTTCSFGPLDRKLTVLRLENMSRWAPPSAIGAESLESGATPLIASGVSFASIQRLVTFADPHEAESAVADALAAADGDGWLQNEYTDPNQSRQKTLPLGLRGSLDVYVSPDSPTLVVNLRALD
jgi:hypothetical protein